MTFSTKLDAVYAAIEGWHRPSEDSLRQLGASLTNAEVTEALQRIEELAEERARIALDPELNCDAEDDVHFAQKDIATALRHLKPESVDALMPGLQSSSSSVRFWSSLAAQNSASPKHLDLLRIAHSSETDTSIKEILEEALIRIRSLQ